MLEPLSARRRESLYAFAARDTSYRVARASITYLLLLCSLGFASNAFVDHPILMWPNAVAITVTVIFRLILHRNQEKIYARSPILWRRLSVAATVVIGGCCGFIYAGFTLLYGYEQWTFLVLMLWLTGILAGSLVTLMADLTMIRILGLLVCVPPLTASLYIGGLKGYCYGFTLFVYLVFLFAQGRQIHNIYWQQLIGRELEAERNEELERARKTAEEASHAKSRFLAQMSHEIRTPMHGVLGLAGLLLRTDLTAQQRELLEVLSSSADGLLLVINDILDLSKVEAGKLTFECVPVDVRRLAWDLISILQSRALAKRIRLTAEVDESLPPLLLCDPVRLRQVLTNLLGNAIKFTTEGGVALQVSVLEPADAVRTRVRFSVTDTGIGIPPEKHALIFDAFTQADETIHNRFGGTGLGLAISSQIVNVMGSRLEVQSEPGKGSQFSFVCDLERGQEKLAEVAKSNTGYALTRKLHILVAEDNLVNQLVLKKTLITEGHTVVIVGNGLEAVNAALATDFDLILMDNQMPELNGIEATRLIKAKRPELPIIGVSANAMEGDREQFLKAGMDGYVSKPFRLEELLTAIENCLELKAA
jgi:signal transduction histidine kinase/ActR/RegA family two-component response regulator